MFGVVMTWPSALVTIAANLVLDLIDRRTATGYALVIRLLERQLPDRCGSLL